MKPAIPLVMAACVVTPGGLGAAGSAEAREGTGGRPVRPPVMRPTLPPIRSMPPGLRNALDAARRRAAGRDIPVMRAVYGPSPSDQALIDELNQELRNAQTRLGLSEAMLLTAKGGKYGAAVIIAVINPFAGAVYWVIEGTTEVYVTNRLDTNVKTRPDSNTWRAQSAGQRAGRESIYQTAGEIARAGGRAAGGPVGGLVAAGVTKTGIRWVTENQLKEAFREGGRMEVRTGRDPSPGADNQDGR